MLLVYWAHCLISPLIPFYVMLVTCKLPTTFQVVVLRLKPYIQTSTFNPEKQLYYYFILVWSSNRTAKCISTPCLYLCLSLHLCFSQLEVICKPERHTSLLVLNARRSWEPCSLPLEAVPRAFAYTSIFLGKTVSQPASSFLQERKQIHYQTTANH